MYLNTQWAEGQSCSEGMEEPGKDQGGAGLSSLSARSQDWAAEGSEGQRQGEEMEEEVGRGPREGLGQRCCCYVSRRRSHYPPPPQ